MHLVILESPFAGDVANNITYARACLRDSLSRGEAPIASHLLYTQEGVLDDDIPHERRQGIDAGLAWRTRADRSVVYIDRGISTGMEYGIAAAKASGIPVEYRSLEGKELPVENTHKKDVFHIALEHVKEGIVRAIILEEDDHCVKSVYDIVEFSLDSQRAPTIRLISKFLLNYVSPADDVEVFYSAQWNADISRLRSVESCLRRILQSHPGKSCDFGTMYKLN